MLGEDPADDLTELLRAHCDPWLPLATATDHWRAQPAAPRPRSTLRARLPTGRLEPNRARHAILEAIRDAAPATATAWTLEDTHTRATVQSAIRDAVERDFTRVRRVEDYARALGYSPRTLSRATLTAAGVGAKEYLDRRVILEAKRLLAHSDRSAAQIATQLGFSSATNFTKYFHQRTGASPIAFRAHVRGDTPRGPA